MVAFGEQSCLIRDGLQEKKLRFGLDLRFCLGFFV